MPYAWKFPGDENDVTYVAFGPGRKRFWEEQGDDITIISWGDD